MPYSLPQAYYSTLGRSLLLTVGAAAFVAVGYFVVGHAAEMDDPGLAGFMGWLCIAFFGACMLVGIVGIFKKRIILTLTEEGIQFPKGTLVRWQDIAGFDVIKMHSNKFVAAILKDPEEWLTRHPQAKWATNYSMTGTPVVFSMAATAVKAKDMVATLSALHTHYGVSDV